MRRLRMMANGIAAVLCLIGLLASGDFHAQKPTKTITGTVKRAETYRGKVRSVYIEDRENGDFLVVRGTENGKALLKQVGVMVRATGYVRKSVRDQGFAQVIDILSYEIDRLDEFTSEQP